MNSNFKIRPLKIVETLFLMGVFFKQFYIFESGSIQIGDICFMLAFGLGCLLGLLKFKKIDQPLVVFVILTFIINGLYFLRYKEGFILSSLYLLFNLVIVILFRFLMNNNDFVNNFSSVLKVNLIFQISVLFLGVGRYLGGSRYQGTFNDPNQFAFFIMTNFFLMYLTSAYRKEHINPIWYLLTAGCVLSSVSSGMIVAFGIFLVFALLIPFLKNKKKVFKVFALFGAFMIIFLLAFNLNSIFLTLSEVTNLSVINSVIYRINQKVDLLGSYEGLMGYVKDREMLRVFIEPQYFLYGCGEGMHDRFLHISGEYHEIHNSVMGLFYYYGLIPFIFLVMWVKRNVYNLPVESYGCMIALFLEALTLVNHRQPFFWMCIVIGSLLYQKNKHVNIKGNT